MAAHPNIDDLIRTAAAELKVYPSDLSWWSWPETWSSTAGPRGGIGGQAFTQFQVYGFRTMLGEEGRLYCAGVWKPWPWDECQWNRPR